MPPQPSNPVATNGYHHWRFYVSVRVGLESCYLYRCDSRAERGVRADSPAWSEPSKRNRDSDDVRNEKTPRNP